MFVNQAQGEQAVKAALGHAEVQGYFPKSHGELTHSRSLAHSLCGSHFLWLYIFFRAGQSTGELELYFSSAVHIASLCYR